MTEHIVFIIICSVLQNGCLKLYPSTSKDEAILSTALQIKSCESLYVIIYNFCICAHGLIMLYLFSYNACLSIHAHHLG